MLHHVELYVRSLSDSRRFWGWLLEELGYSLYQDWDQGFSYKMEGTYLVFVQAENRFLDIPYHRCRPGLNHLAFWAKSREEVDIFTEKLKQQNITILYTDKHPYAGGPSHYAVYFEDPDRMKVEIVAPS
ncbi:VOC family protein [Peribacillus alkalitolerans]|uniref:VOC family protein n=1 Tax=Peribacillus alkalitolerans TaxID=1550385 RepID=UPI0013D5AD19|nr:VOC family protein [Peribacillus alkalitolerans]